MATKKPIDLNKKAEEIMAIAEKQGAEKNFMFLTTFRRYQVQIKILSNLEKIISSEPSLVTKEYVKARQNLYAHPAIREYNNTCTAANNTTATLIKILTSLQREEDPEDDALIKFMNGREEV